MSKNKENNSLECISAIVFRFRDKSTTNTINDHKSIIKDKEFVLWGWWAKSHEKLPSEELNDIRTHLSNTRFFLFHSEKRELYEATCKEFYSKEDRSMDSPAPLHTPAYYNELPCKLWLKFTSIEEVSHEVLGHYSYKKDTSLFLEKRVYNHFIEYNDKAVNTSDELDELFYQQRTIWFLRDKKSTDQITDKKSEMKFRSTISKDFYKCNSNRLLLLSDTHFSNEMNKHIFALDDDDNDDLTKTSLYEAIEAEMKDFPVLAGLLMAGDFTYKPIPEEFALVKGFINKLKEKFSLKEEQLILVPGNHDIAFSDDPDDNTKYKQVKVAAREAQKEYSNFYHQIYGIYPNEYLCTVKRLILKNNLPVEIIGLNSNYLQQDKNHFIGQGFVGRRQLEFIKTEMELAKQEDTYSFRILMLHHHLIPVEFRTVPKFDVAQSVTLDSGAIQEFIAQNKIKLVVHGHAHQDHFIKAGFPIKKENEEFHEYYILGLGSAGAQIQQGAQNSFTTLDFDTIGKIKIAVMQITPNGYSNQKILLTHTLNLC